MRRRRPIGSVPANTVFASARLISDHRLTAGDVRLLEMPGRCSTGVRRARSTSGVAAMNSAALLFRRQLRSFHFEPRAALRRDAG